MNKCEFGCMIGFWADGHDYMVIRENSGESPPADTYNFKYCPDCGRELDKRQENEKNTS